MSSEQWAKIKGIFDSALEMPPEERHSFVASACSGDEQLRREVTRLLDEFDKTETFLDQPLARLSYSLTPEELVAGRYRVVQLLGRGGMGEVYEVRDEFLNETAALKTLRADLSADPEFLRRFQDEIQFARRVTHPSVCRVYEVGVHKPAGGLPPLHFFTMQLLQGETLAQRIRRDGRLSAAQAFPVIVQMAEGLQAAHEQGIIHRDFKSGNVILTASRAVVTDFGLAGLDARRAGDSTADRITSEAKITGTVAYMSPEQMSGQPITPASDIYSFGIVLFEMATGRLPFEDRHIIHSAMQRARGDVPSVRALAPDIDTRWETAIRRCLEIEPARRYQSAGELARMFGSAGWSLPRVYWSRRRWVAVGAAGAISVTAGGALWRWSRRPYEPKPETLTWYQRGVDAFRNVTYEAARRDLEKAVALDPRYAPAQAWLAAAYSELFLSERATESVLQAVSAAQDEKLSDLDAMRVRGFQYVIARDFGRAQPAFEQLRSSVPASERAGALADLAWLVFKREDNNAAIIPLLEQALKLDPGFAGAKLRMAIATDRLQKRDAAQQLYAEAESLFNTASNYEGVCETLLQRASSLARANRNREAEDLLNRAMALAVSMDDVHHEIRVLLALSIAYRNTGEIEKSRDTVERGLKIAMDSRMDAPAAVGLIDLGTAYLQLGEPEAAERYFQQGLEYANRGRSLFSVARAQFSLASLYAQFDRPAGAAQYVEPALKFFRSSGYPRESMKSMLVLGSAQDSLALFEPAAATLSEAARSAEQIQAREDAGLARLFLGSVLEKTGRWADAQASRTEALAVFGEIRGGLRAAYTFLARGRLYAQAGRFPEAAADLEQARARVQKMEGKQSQLRARLSLAAAEIAYYQADWPQALRLAREAAVANGGPDENSEAGEVTGLIAIRTGSIETGLLAWRQSLLKEGPFESAHGKLMLAQALWENQRAADAAPIAQEALAFFEPRHVWEAIWRCRRLLADDNAARQALEEVKRIWPEDMVRPYLARPDLKKLVFA